jgi:hypothetical protein
LLSFDGKLWKALEFQIKTNNEFATKKAMLDALSDA